MAEVSPERYPALYDWAGHTVREYITSRVPPSASILDVGPGWGKYRHLLPEYAWMDACEVWQPTVDDEKLEEIYRRVFVKDIYDLVKEWGLSPYPIRYDLIIMGDVFEHIEREKMKELLPLLEASCVELCVVVPYGYEQGTVDDNPYQAHLQDDLDMDLMRAEYPSLSLQALEIVDEQIFKGFYTKRS